MLSPGNLNTILTTTTIIIPLKLPEKEDETLVLVLMKIHSHNDFSSQNKVFSFELFNFGFYLSQSSIVTYYDMIPSQNVAADGGNDFLRSFWLFKLDSDMLYFKKVPVSWAPATAHGALVGSAALDPVQKLVYGGCDNTIKVWKRYNETWKMDFFPALQMHRDWARGVSWAPNLGINYCKLFTGWNCYYMDCCKGRRPVGR
ncbi:hypothetical protein C5167_000329 [Papaver somniferum]|uniref:Uncharacterized protein n=1 Tax=Papaver somniferum TaxID=3469 RepID=A0A4Y7KV41_PAPSO|nr:hypothetical protein C5167_000329 [Papaver somniferum]